MEVDLPPIGAQRWVSIGDRGVEVAQLGDEDRGTAGLTVGLYRRNVDIEGNAIRAACEIEVGGPVFPALEVEPTGLERGGIHVGAEIHGRPPRQVVALV